MVLPHCFEGLQIATNNIAIFEFQFVYGFDFWTCTHCVAWMSKSKHKCEATPIELE